MRLVGWLGLLILALPFAVLLAWREVRWARAGCVIVAVLALMASFGVSPEWTFAQPGRFVPLAAAGVLGVVLVAVAGIRWNLATTKH